VTAADFRDSPNEEEHHEEVDAWIPLGLAYEMTGGAADRGGTGNWALGRMKPGVTLAQAREDLAAINQHLAKTYPQTDVGYTLVPRPLKEYLLSTLFSPTRILLIASFCLLLVAAPTWPTWSLRGYSDAGASWPFVLPWALPRSSSRDTC